MDFEEEYIKRIHKRLDEQDAQWDRLANEVSDMKGTIQQIQQCLGTFTQSLRRMEVSKTEILNDLRNVGRVLGVPVSNGSCVDPVIVGFQTTTVGIDEGNSKVEWEEKNKQIEHKQMAFKGSFEHSKASKSSVHKGGLEQPLIKAGFGIHKVGSEQPLVKAGFGALTQENDNVISSEVSNGLFMHSDLVSLSGNDEQGNDARKVFVKMQAGDSILHSLNLRLHWHQYDPGGRGKVEWTLPKPLSIANLSLDEWPKASSDDLESSKQYSEQALGSPECPMSGVQRQVAAKILISWFKEIKCKELSGSPAVFSKLPSHFKQWLLDLLACSDPTFPTKDSHLPYAEFSRIYRKMRNKASQLLRAMETSGMFTDMLLKNKIDVEILSADKAISFSKLQPLCSDSDGSESSGRQMLDDRESIKQRRLTTLDYLKCVHSNLHVIVSALVAAAVAWMSELPAQFNPIILPLMASIKREHEAKMLQNAAEGAAFEAEWNAKFAEYEKKYLEEAVEFKSIISDQLLVGWEKSLPAYTPKSPSKATRNLSMTCRNALAMVLPGFLGGSADLASSNMTPLKIFGDCQQNTPEELKVRFGVREHVMGAICNGITLHNPDLIPYYATFIVFIDCMRGTMRISTLCETGVIYILTHDSIGPGEVGPTHQPTKHLASFCTVPDILMLRPTGGNETVGAYKVVVYNQEVKGVVSLQRLLKWGDAVTFSSPTAKSLDFLVVGGRTRVLPSIQFWLSGMRSHNTTIVDHEVVFHENVERADATEQVKKLNLSIVSFFCEFTSYVDISINFILEDKDVLKEWSLS